MRFEDRLARTVASAMGLALLGACGGGSKDDDGSGFDTGGAFDLATVCAGAPAPKDFSLSTGFVVIDPGAECPSVDDAQLESPGCSFREWQDITCSFTEVDRNQVYLNDGYGGYYVDAGSVSDTGGSYYSTDGVVVDVCYYEGVFYRDPDAGTCGRPLLRDGKPVVARVVAGLSGWVRGGTPLAAALNTEHRRSAAAYWLECAQLEHASVASFSHFALDLMRFGAPPELLHGAHQAALDEIEHARLCFALASAYHGAPLQPGPLTDAPPPAASSLIEVASALVREGCIGETLAALDAAARLAVATDPAVRAALQVILRDESAHAALAWRALRWILEQDVDGSVAAHLAQVFEEEGSRWTLTPPKTSPLPAPLSAHGLLSPHERARQLARGWNDVIAPSWAAATSA